MAAPARLAAALIATPDPENLSAFYQATLDLGEPHHVSDEHIGYRTAGAYLGFDRAAVVPVRGGVTLWFEVDDLEASAARMVAAGAGEVTEPFATGEQERGVTLRDPEGNLVGLIASEG